MIFISLFSKSVDYELEILFKNKKNEAKIKKSWSFIWMIK